MDTINKIALVSDLHLDFWIRFYRQRIDTPFLEQLFEEIIDKCLATDPDIIVLAGDVSNGDYQHTSPIRLPVDENHPVPIYFVPGNHDFYGHHLPSSHQTVVEGDVVMNTLWTNFSGDIGREAMIYSRISDSIAIKQSNAYAVQNLCNQSFEAIINSNKSIVVTHFPPSRQSVDLKRFQGDPMNSYFTNDFDRELFYSNSSIKLWLCGHVHHRHHYYIGDMLVACNPLGYPNEQTKSISNYQPMILTKGDSGIWKVEK